VRAPSTLKAAAPPPDEFLAQTKNCFTAQRFRTETLPSCHCRGGPDLERPFIMGSDWDGKERRRIDKGQEIRGRILKLKRQFERSAAERSRKAPSAGASRRTRPGKTP
jgi:hypothetical protein